MRFLRCGPISIRFMGSCNCFRGSVGLKAVDLIGSSAFDIAETMEMRLQWKLDFRTRLKRKSQVWSTKHCQKLSKLRKTDMRRNVGFVALQGDGLDCLSDVGVLEHGRYGSFYMYSMAEGFDERAESVLPLDVIYGSE